MMSWESDSPIVPVTSGNAERGKDNNRDRHLFFLDITSVKLYKKIEREGKK